MQILTGKHNTATVFTDNIDEATKTQIELLLDQSFAQDSQIRIMPDTHAGKGCVIGTTMTITDKVVPNLVGVDAGCGVNIAEFKTENLDFEKLDQVIRQFVPSGNAVRNKPHALLTGTDMTPMLDRLHVPLTARERNRIDLGLGSLGGGNHFIEVNQSDDGRTFISVHTGSRGLGVKVAKHHQGVAITNNGNYADKLSTLIENLKQEGRHNEIQHQIKTFKESQPDIPKALTYLEGDQMQMYLHDLQIAQVYASYNRKAILQEIIREMNWKFLGIIESVHNYIDLDDMVLRKGAIRADLNQDIVVPINMRDGSLIARGKGNPDWNNSSPHGAGRILSRTKAKQQLDLEAVKVHMQNVYTTSLSEKTLDEAPGAYKTLEEIIKNTRDTMEILDIVKPVYNFKASE